jgi:hypothetical protein
MMVEVSDPSAVEWTRPTDYGPRDEQPLQGLIGLRGDGFLAAMCGGSVRLIAAAIDPETLRRLFTRNDGQPIQLP